MCFFLSAAAFFLYIEHSIMMCPCGSLFSPLHIPPTDLTRMSIQTTLTRRSIRAEIRRKNKNEEKEKVKKVFLVEEGNRVDIKWRKMG